MTMTMNKTNWASLYEPAKLKKWGLPAFEITKPEEGTFNKLYLRWSDLPANTDDGEPLGQYVICADVLVIDQSATINQATYVFARRIEVVNGVVLTLNREEEPTPFLLAAQEVVTVDGRPSKLEIKVQDANAPKVVSYVGNKAAFTALELAVKASQEANENAEVAAKAAAKAAVALALAKEAASKPGANEATKAAVAQAQAKAEAADKIEADKTALAVAAAEKEHLADEAANAKISVLEWEDAPEVRQYQIGDQDQFDDAHLLEGEPLRVHLRCIFQLGVLLMSDHVELSKAQFNWVAALAKGSEDTRTILGEARSLSANIDAQAMHKGITLVPYLDYKVYSESAEAFLGLLNRRQDKQDQLKATLKDTQQWLKAAEAALQENKADEELNENLLQKATASRAQVLEARATVARQIVYARLVLLDAEKQFEAGIEIWKRKKIIEEALSLVMGIFKILSAIPTMIIAGPEMGISSFMSIAKGVIDVAAKGVGMGTGTNMAPFSASAGAGGALLYESAKNYQQALNDDAQRDPLPVAVPIGGNDIPPAPPAPVVYLPPGVIPPPPPPPPVAGAPPAPMPPPVYIPVGVVPPAPPPPPVVADYNIANQNDIQNVQLTNKELAAKQKAAQLEFAKGVAEIGDGAKQIMDAGKAIADTIAKAKKLEKSAQAALLASNNAINTTFSSVDLQGVDVVTGGAQVWDDLAAAVEGLFENNAILGQIYGGNAYRKEMNRLILLGKTYAMTRLAVAKADAELAEMIMRKRSAGQVVSIYQSRVKELGAEAVNDATIAQLAFGKILDAKRAVYLAMESYRRAYVYHTLDDNPPPLPKFSDTTEDFNSAVVPILRKQLVLESLKDAPQTIPSPKYQIGVNDIPTALFQTGTCTIKIPTSSPLFDGMYRVRLNKIRIYPEGLQSDRNIKVKITSSGVYSDKTRTGKERIFASKKLNWNFIYDSKDPSNITGDGDIARRYKDDFFHPTPFTEWTIVVTDQSDKKLDYKAITGLRIEISGVFSSR